MYPCHIIRSGLAITARIMVGIVADITAVLGVMEGTTAVLDIMANITAVLGIMALTIVVLVITVDAIHLIFTIIIVTDCTPVYIKTMAIDRMGDILTAGTITDTAVKTIMYKTIVFYADENGESMYEYVYKEPYVFDYGEEDSQDKDAYVFQYGENSGNLLAYNDAN